MSDTQPTDLIRNEQELLALTGVEDASHLADALWRNVDGVVSFGEDGIDLQPGFQHEGLNYPFTLRQLHELARRLEESEVPLQAAAGAPPLLSPCPRRGSPRTHMTVSRITPPSWPRSSSETASEPSRHGR